ncbi:MAG TPA: hypothetical protein VFO39_08870 [Candidatus Sulfotelmatobacter sp.]|nr:hypothetical protein [Candidatus Sulfotelmatobacter sp.]
MQAFHIRYRNTQGTLMRILNAASRRGLDLMSVHAEIFEQNHRVLLALDANHKQVGQLLREWYSISDVIDVWANEGLRSHETPRGDWATPHPPASAGGKGAAARAALA